MSKQQPFTDIVGYNKFYYRIIDCYLLSVTGIRVLFKEGLWAFLLKVINWFEQWNLRQKPINYSLSVSNGEIPPSELAAFVGDGDFVSVGNEFLAFFTNLCDLKPDETILDVGCGIGRMAIPLTKYLNNNGTYHGFDIVGPGIDWCNNNITSKHPNFHFQLVEIYNKAYNPNGTVRTREFRFPYDDDSFDFVFLTSVFTHMLPDDIDHYLDEINRVLKSGGRCLITFFLLNKDSCELIKKGESTLNFRYGRAICKFEKWQMPECAIAYQEDFIRGLYKTKLLHIKTPIYYGNWCGRENTLTYQDIITAEKSSNK
jgi:ubiquinone/menaquinone biosynthesis C-methylase UbiE